MEIWKDVEEYDGRIMISNFGNVRSNKTNRNLKTVIKNSGYLKVSITYKTISKTHTIHRLVAMAFIPNRENKATVNHKDGNKLNNHVDNLEWATLGENHKHAFRNGLRVTPWAKKVINTKTKEVFNSITEANKTFKRGPAYLELQLKSENNKTDFIYLL